MQQLIFLFFLFIITAYWIDSVRVKELAKRAGAIQCKQQDVQFLDNTVIKHKTRLVRHHANLFQIQRQYHFEYSVHGDERETGIIIFSGHHLKEIQMNLHTYDNDKQA